MPQYLVLIRPTRPEMLVTSTPEEDRVVGEHFDYLKCLAAKGIVLMAGRTLNDDPSSFGIIVFVADSEAAAARRMNEDPAVVAGVFRAELYPYRVALASSGILE